MTDRDQVLRKIRALLQKTVANGCPVEEALAAHAKAQALIDEYQVSHEELYGTGPGGRWQKAEPEPAEPKQQQQAASKKSARTGVLFPFKTAITVGIVLIVAVLWGKSVVAGVNGPFKSSQVVEAPKDNVATPWPGHSANSRRDVGRRLVFWFLEKIRVWADRDHAPRSERRCLTVGGPGWYPRQSRDDAWQRSCGSARGVAEIVAPPGTASGISVAFVTENQPGAWGRRDNSPEGGPPGRSAALSLRGRDRPRP